jgi:hypothetical protein
VIRTLLAGCAVAVVSVGLVSGCGGSGKSSAANALMQRESNLYEIDQIEVKWHKATSHHDINLMMSLWAPGAVFNIDNQTLTGKAQIKNWFLTKNKAFSNHWESDTPSYKIRVVMNAGEDKGTLYFECHYIDPKTQKVVSFPGVDHKVQKINGKWLIVDSAGATSALAP